MKPIYLLTIALTLSVLTFAQKQATNPLPRVISTVLQDFPHNLRNISGELILSDIQSENYTSLVTLPGAEECIVTRYHSEEDTTASWQAKMYQDENFKNVATRYKELYKQLKACYLKTVDGSMLFLNGEWEAPGEENKFTISTLRVITGDERYKNVKIDLEMLYQFPLWKININIVSKKKDTLED